MFAFDEKRTMIGKCSGLEELEKEEDRVKVASAIGKLANRHRDIIMLRYWENKTWSDIANVIGVGRKHAKKLYLMAIDKLRVILDDCQD